MNADAKPTNGSNGSGNKLPAWAAWLLAMTVPIVGGAIGYGELKADVKSIEQRAVELKADVHSLDRRIEILESRHEEHEKDIYKAIGEIRNSLGGVQLDLAKVCVRLKC